MARVGEDLGNLAVCGRVDQLEVAVSAAADSGYQRRRGAADSVGAAAAAVDDEVHAQGGVRGRPGQESLLVDSKPLLDLLLHPALSPLCSADLGRLLHDPFGGRLHGLAHRCLELRWCELLPLLLRLLLDEGFVALLVLACALFEGGSLAFDLGPGGSERLLLHRHHLRLVALLRVGELGLVPALGLG